MNHKIVSKLLSDKYKYTCTIVIWKYLTLKRNILFSRNIVIKYFCNVCIYSAFVVFSSCVIVIRIKVNVQSILRILECFVSCKTSQNVNIEQILA